MNITAAVGNVAPMVGSTTNTMVQSTVSHPKNNELAEPLDPSYLYQNLDKDISRKASDDIQGQSLSGFVEEKRDAPPPPAPIISHSDTLIERVIPSEDGMAKNFNYNDKTRDR